MLEETIYRMTQAIHNTQGVKPKVTHIPVKYVRAINPDGNEILVSEKEMRIAEELGLSLRRINE